VSDLYVDIENEVMDALEPPSWRYLALVALLMLGAGTGALVWYYQIRYGMGTTGLNLPVCWGTYITNFVFWIGIGHAGTLISAILYLFRVDWRAAVYRSAETMTIFAVLTAGMFPLIHLGRVWVFYWLLPYPNQRHMWPNFQSPLVLDVLAVSTYLIVSVIFWYTGLIPDLAAVRDRVTGWRKKLYTFLAMGWQGRNDQWRHYLRAYTCLACLATPLVISVHSVVSWDFAVALLPGWHSTIFPPYFVAGAIHSGLAMVITLLIPLRKVLGLDRIIQKRHLTAMAKLNILTGSIMLYAYLVEPFMSWYSGGDIERALVAWRGTGPYAIYYWGILFLNGVLPLLYFNKKLRTWIPSLFVISLLVNVGMWLERYVIIVPSLAHDFIPHVWHLYTPSWVELTISIGAGCFFLGMFLITVRIMPPVSIVEARPDPELEEAPA